VERKCESYEILLMTRADKPRIAETVQSGKQPGKIIAAYKVLLQMGLAK
jgi:hypothetical protein